MRARCDMPRKLRVPCNTSNALSLGRASSVASFTPRRFVLKICHLALAGESLLRPKRLRTVLERSIWCAGTLPLASYYMILVCVWKMESFPSPPRFGAGDQAILSGRSAHRGGRFLGDEQPGQPPPEPLSGRCSAKGPLGWGADPRGAGYLNAW